MIMVDLEKRKFEVGDVIVIKNWYNTTKIQVTRVTKTQAVCEIKRPDGTGYTRKYKIEYIPFAENDNRAHVFPIPRTEWNTNEYYVYPKEETTL